MTQYVAITNTPGYLPMDDDPPVFDTTAEAWQYLIDERLRAADDSFDTAYTTFDEEDDTTFDEEDDDALAEMRDLMSVKGALGVVYGTTPGYADSHDLGIAYSVAVAEVES